MLVFDPDNKEGVVFPLTAPEQIGIEISGSNLTSEFEPAVRTTSPSSVLLAPDETREAAIEFSRRHPWEVRLVPRVLPAIGAAVPKHSDSGPVDLLASLNRNGFLGGSDVHRVWWGWDI
jgi:hypothetical protein